jgi:transcriptional regulator with GAF, ATPase, and Fis domain
VTPLRILSIGLPLGATVVNIVAATVVLVGAKDRRVALSFVASCLCLAAWSLSVAMQCIPNFSTMYPAVVGVFSTAIFILPAAVFSNVAVWSELHDRPTRAVTLLGYGIAGLFYALDWMGIVFRGSLDYPWGSVRRPGPAYSYAFAFNVVWILLAIIFCWRAIARSDRVEVRLRLKYWLFGVALCFPLGLVNVLSNFGLNVFRTGGLGNVLFVCVIGYAAVRHRLMDIDLFVMRMAATLLASMAVVLPVAGAVIWAWNLPLGLSGSLVVGSLLLAALVSLLAFSRFRTQLEAQLERSLFPARRAARDMLRQLSADVVKLEQSANLGERCVATVVQGLGLDGAALYLRTAQTDRFKLARAEGRIASPPLLLRTQSDEDTDSPPPPEDGSNADWEACLPVCANGATLGFLALGQKRSGAAIDDSDVTLLGMVAAQLAIALQNAEYVQQIQKQKAEIEELHKRLQAENVVLRAEVRAASQFKEIIGSSVALQRVLALVEKVAPTDASVLITGETGTGKELIARAIHDLSPRRDGPLISVNCPAIPPGLAESELFGHERGAFTDAVEARPGKFELADGGTIFLDEIADLSLALQVKLLRVLQEHETQRVGSRRVRKLDLRVVAATNRDLHAEIRAQRFREDLYYRLATVCVHVPPLRERTDDVPMLASYFLERAATTYQKAITGFTPEALAALSRYNWPGNIRELQNVVERAVLLASGPVIRPEHLSDLAVSDVPPQHLGTLIRQEKLRRVEAALVQSGGNQAAAARLLGISPSNLARLMKSLGMKPPASIQ